MRDGYKARFSIGAGVAAASAPVCFGIEQAYQRGIQPLVSKAIPYENMEIVQGLAEIGLMLAAGHVIVTLGSKLVGEPTARIVGRVSGIDLDRLNEPESTRVMRI